jgi:hypothetical protein
MIEYSDIRTGQTLCLYLCPGFLSFVTGGAVVARGPVAGAGGVFRAPVIWDRFAELTGAVRPAACAAVGAALLAGQRQSGRA